MSSEQNKPYLLNLPIDTINIVVSFAYENEGDLLIRKVSNMCRSHFREVKFYPQTKDDLQSRLKLISIFPNVRFKILASFGSYFGSKLSDIVKLRGNVYDVALYGFQEINADILKGVPRVSIQGCWFTNILNTHVLGDVEYLNLSGLDTISDVSLFSKVRSLNLSGCINVTNVEALSKVHTLNLSGCNQVSDVSALGNAHYLNLSFVRGKISHGIVNSRNFISDVSALGRVHTLNLSDCINITDVSALGGVHTLNLSGCFGISEVNMLGRVHTLNLSRCNMVSDVSKLGNVYDLNLSECFRISDVSMLGGVHYLNLEDCCEVTTLKGLEGVCQIRINMCNSIPDVENLDLPNVMYVHDCDWGDDGNEYEYDDWDE